MIGPFLRNGTITDFEPLGAGGARLFESAKEIRAELQRRLGPEFAARLAIVQSNDYGDTFDWYAPESGPVLSWDALSDEQRRAVQEEIDDLRTKLLTLSHRLVGENKPALKVLGRLLEHAGTIPDTSHIYLVGDRPVLTFWGFRQHGKYADTTKPIGGGTVGRKPSSDECQRSYQPDVRPPPAPIATPTLRPDNTLRWRFMLLGLTGVLALAYGLYFMAPQLTGWSVVDHVGKTAQPDVEPPPEPLVFPTPGEFASTADFLTGQWQASSEALVESDSKHPIALAYDLTAGAGEVTITEQGGAVCRAQVDASFDGNTLTLAPRGPIRCPNRADYYGVTVICRPSTDRRAVCLGRFPNGKEFSVALGRRK